MSVEISDEQDIPIDRQRLQKRLQAGLEKAGLGDSEVSVLLTGDERITELNETYRGLPEPTDVLSFSLDDEEDASDNFLIQENKLEAKELLQMIRKLPDGYRVVFNLYAIEGFNHKEIAQQLNITEGTSKSQYARARQFLQKMLTEEKVK